MPKADEHSCRLRTQFGNKDQNVAEVSGDIMHGSRAVNVTGLEQTEKLVSSPVTSHNVYVKEASNNAEAGANFNPKCRKPT